MNIDRRTFVKTALAGAALGAADAYGWLLGSQTDGTSGTVSAARRAVVLLQSGTAQDQPFSTGVEVSMRRAARALPQVVRLPRAAFWDLRELRPVLDQAEGKAMLGMMDDAAFAIFSELARDRGARLVSFGQHSWGGDSRYGSCHSILSAPRASGIGTAIAAALRSDDGGFMLTESSLGSHDSGPRSSASLSATRATDRGWAFVMGQGEAHAKLWPQIGAWLSLRDN
jgi:hypothetical protein